MPKSIVVVDNRVTGYRTLIDDLTQSSEVFILDGASDGLAQMAAYLQGRTGIDALHIISHADEWRLDPRIRNRMSGIAYLSKLAGHSHGNH